MTEPADLARNLKNARPLAWYRPGRQVEAANYTYGLTAPPGKQFAEDFRPALTPQQMLRAGVFEGKYLNDSWGEFPREWFAAGLRAGRLRAVADPAANAFAVKSRLSLGAWLHNGWIRAPARAGDPRREARPPRAAAAGAAAVGLRPLGVSATATLGVSATATLSVIATATLSVHLRLQL